MAVLGKTFFLLVVAAAIQEVQCTIEGVYDFCDTNDVKEITLTSGTLTEPQNVSLYDGNMFCFWSIQDLNNKDVLYFNVSYIQLESNSIDGRCNTERFMISNALTNSYNTWADLCGTINTPTYVYGVSNAAKIYFLSSASGPTNHGFTLSWFYAPICSAIRKIISEQDSITSFTWPWYDGTPDCVYEITVPVDYIRISVKSFSKTGSSCDEDYLEIANANDPTEIWHKFCDSVSSATHKFGAGNSARITHHRTSDTGSFQLSWAPSQTKGMTMAERQAATIGAAVGSGCFMVLLIALLVVVKCVKTSPCYYKRPKVTTLTPNEQTYHPPIPKPYVPPYLQPGDFSIAHESGLPHIMLSYQRNVKHQVLQFRRQLDEAGYRVWIDVEQTHKKSSKFDATAEGIEKAAIIVPILTSKYQESVNCRKEIEFADKHKTPIIPVRMEQKFKPTKWLSFLLGNTLWHDLSNPKTYDAQLANFLDAISHMAETARREPANNGIESDNSENEDRSAHQV